MNKIVAPVPVCRAPQQGHHGPYAPANLHGECADAVGPISFVLATFFMRLLAYSSMEHMALATGGFVSRFQSLCEGS